MTTPDDDTHEPTLDDLKAKLQGVGKKCFIESFWDFSTHVSSETQAELIELIQVKNDVGSRNAARTKASSGLWIFRHGLERQALKLIVDSQLSLGDRRRARTILDML